MSFYSSASNASCWRGYEYCEGKKVLSFEKKSETEYVGIVQGSQTEPYNVRIDIVHPRKSECDCPFANGRKICKHMVALAFTALPSIKAEYLKEIEESEREAERQEQENREEIMKYVNTLTKAELREMLIEYMYDERYGNHYW